MEYFAYGGGNNLSIFQSIQSVRTPAISERASEKFVWKNFSRWQMYSWLLPCFECLIKKKMATLLAESKVQDCILTSRQCNSKLRVGSKMCYKTSDPVKCLICTHPVGIPGSSHSQAFLLRGLGKMVSLKQKAVFVSDHGCAKDQVLCEVFGGSRGFRLVGSAQCVVLATDVR